MVLSVVVATPAHSALTSVLSYTHSCALPAGTLVRAPLGRRQVLGVVWPSAADSRHTQDASPTLKPIDSVFEGLTPLGPAWLRLIDFTARYYQRSPGEVALAALPPQLRELDESQWTRRLRRQARQAQEGTALRDAAQAGAAPEQHAESQAPRAAAPPSTTPEQAEALSHMAQEQGPFLLFGSTGSGKTEVYFQAIETMLRKHPEGQALILVPEINLTPQLHDRVLGRFGAQTVASLHSGLSPAQRLQHWWAAHEGRVRIVLGTRMAVLASLPRLRLIVVDEEHDASYKQQEGARYSARDLAVFRAHAESCKVILGSATPSIESWYHSRSKEEGGRYVRLHMPSRVGGASLPQVRLVDMRQQPRGTLLAPPVLEAIAQRVAHGEQCMLLLNRRGYAPVLHCGACDWKSACPHCSAYRVFHKIDRSLRCHHCGYSERVPKACPECGNLDIEALGSGTEQVEEQLHSLLAHIRRPSGEPLRVARIDADSTRTSGALEAQLAQVHAGEVDVLIGTQMIAKGHDFRRMGLVLALYSDGALFSSDFRGSERLFALLMQAAGRAGRDAAQLAPEMWIQTHHPGHPLFQALAAHDYPAMAERLLTERAQASLPPFQHQALLRADAKSQAAAQAFLQAARDRALSGPHPAPHSLVFYSPVPLSMQRVANVERAQLLIESPSRPALQHFLAAWQADLQALRKQASHKAAFEGLLRWGIDVDPQSI